MFDENVINWDESKTTTGSGNTATNTANTTTATATFTDVGNTDTSVSGSGNTDNTAEGSFHSGSYNQDWDISDSGNVTTTTTDESDNSTHEYTDNSDHSINAGVRSYDVGAGGAAGAAGGNATIVDQSLNGNVLAGGGVKQWVSSDAVVASGEGSMAAGDDIDIVQNLNGSTNIDAGGDVNIGNTTDITATIGSNNTYTVEKSYTDNSVDLDVDDSFNEANVSWTATDSFNDEFSGIENTEWNIDADVIWGSDTAAIGDSVSVDLDLPEM